MGGEWKNGPANKWLLLFIFLLGFGLRVHLLDQQSLWWDEAKTVSRAFESLPDLFTDIISKRHHLPLYFLVIRPWVTMTGSSEFAVRFFSAVFGTLSLPLIYKTAGLIGGKKVGLTAAFLLAVSPFHIWYSQEARMYTLVTFSLLAAHYFLFRLLKDNANRYWLGYFVSILIALYTHLFTLLILIAHYVYFTLYNRYLKPLTVRWFVSAVFLGLLFSVWGYVILSTGGLGEAAPPWIVPVNWYEPFLTLVAFSNGRTVNLNQPITYVVPIAFLIFLAGTVGMLRSRDTEMSLDKNVARSVFSVRLLYLWLLLPVFLTFIVSLDWPINPNISIYTDRYLIIVLPALIILTALGLARFSVWVKDGRFLPITLMLLTIFTVPGLYNLYYQPQFGREDWRSTAVTLHENAADGDVLWTRLDHQTPLSYYLNEESFTADWYLIPSIAVDAPAFGEEMRQLLRDGAPNANRIWFITQYYNNDLHGFPADRNEQAANPELIDPQLAWLQANFQLLETWQFPGIQINLFQVDKILES